MIKNVYKCEQQLKYYHEILLNDQDNKNIQFFNKVDEFLKNYYKFKVFVPDVIEEVKYLCKEFGFVVWIQNVSLTEVRKKK